MQTHIFSDLKVIELASVLAGPGVGQFFAELGARVIKVENPKTGGDVTRSWLLPGEDAYPGAYFSCVNWGKQSLSLDVTTVDGLKTLYRLLADADIVIVSYKPGDAEKLQLDYEQIKQINPTIIYGCITGYGEDDPRVGYDAIIQAESGFMHINGEPGSDPLKMPVALIDILAGHQLKESLLLALIHKLKTNEGSKVSVSLIQSAVASLANQAANFMVAGKEPQASGSLHPNIAPYGEVFTTVENRKLLLAIGSDKQFSSLLRVLELNFFPQFASNSLRIANRTALCSMLQDAIADHSMNTLLSAIHACHIPAAEINKVSGALALEAVNTMKLDAKGVTGLRTFVGQLSFNQNSSHLLPPPYLGEHNSLIIEELAL